MKKDKKVLADRLELRRKAEERLKKSELFTEFPTSRAELQPTLYELSVHQIELEMQNEQLQHSYDEIQKEHKRYNDLYDFAPVGYLTLARDSTILEANLTIDIILSLGRNKLKGTRFSAFIAQADLPAFNSMMQKVYQSKALEHCEIRIGNISTEEEPPLLDRTFRLDAIISDNIQECHLTLTDISDTRRAFEELKNKEAQYRCLFEAAHEGILILDYKSGKIVDANPCILQLIGFSLDEITGKELWELGFIQDKELARKAYLQLQSKNYVRYSGIPLHHKSGNVIEVEFLSYVYNVSDKKTIQCNIRDITDQIKLREYEKAISTSHKETIHALVSLVEIRDSYTAGHQKRVSELSVAIGKELHLSPKSLEGVHMSAILHDIGKFNIPTELLTKATQLDDPEKEMLRNHSLAGYDVLKGIHFPWPIALTVLQHHERLDGSGYPNGLKGSRISEAARIIAVADTVEAMTGARPYRPAIGLDKALMHIQQEKGRLFDPVIVDACIWLFQEKKFRFSSRPASESLVSPEGGMAKVYNSL